MSELLYTKMKIFHYKDKIDSLPESVDNILPPIHIRIKPTNMCNHNCRYCAYRADHMQLGKDMIVKHVIPKESMRTLLDDIIEMGVHAVSFSGGGDPFCYPFFFETINKLAKSPVRFAALTNGSKLSGEIAELFAHGGTWIRISIDGWDEKSYSYYRRVPEDEFGKVLKNMENFKKRDGKCYLGVSLVTDNYNADHIYDLIKRVKNVGVNSVKVSPCIVDNDGKKNNQYHRPFFEKVKEQINKSILDLKDDKFEIYDAYHELDEKFTKDYSWCPYIQILPVIGADLNIYSCQDKAYNLEEGFVGSLQNKSLKEFWFSEKKNFFTINPTKQCNNHCVSNTKNKLILEYLNAADDHIMFV